MLDAITPTRVKIRLFSANFTSRPSHLAGPFSLGEGMFILPITPTPLDKFPAHFTGGEVYGQGPRGNSAPTRNENTSDKSRLSDPYIRMVSKETTQGGNHATAAKTKNLCTYG
jgi:hypothetical protein